MPIEVESPEELGYDTIENNLAESSFSDLRLADHGIDADAGDILLRSARSARTSSTSTSAGRTRESSTRSGSPRRSGRARSS
jgi:hypothetical protein